jgi:hypothetical protein
MPYNFFYGADTAFGFGLLLATGGPASWSCHGSRLSKYDPL